jgi:peptidyl-prolyl cis-trans isomerase B (cyclophilin B)
MFPAIAPGSVLNWDSLVSIHFYDSTAFHRVIPGFMIQGGDPNSRSGPKSTWGYGDASQATVNAEFSAVSHHRGILSAARSNDPNSATSQFFICVANPTYLDRQYSVYGHVVQGMNIADSIVKAPRDANDDPLVKISMFITRLGSNDSLESAPKLASPADGFSNGTATKVTLRWHHASDAMMYRLQLATDNSFTNIIIDTTRSQFDTSEIVTKLKSGAYYWKVLANNGGHESEYSEAWKFDVTSSGVAGTKSTGLELSEASPNPSIGNVLIRFHLKTVGSAKLTVQDILGREALRLIDAPTFTAGDHEATVPSGTLRPGIYLYMLESNGETISKRMIIE